MPWARTGDTSGSYPRLLAAAALPDAPPAAVALMLGFITLLAVNSAAFLTDYIVTEGDVRRAGAEQHEWLLKAALKTGLLTRHKQRIHGVRAFKVIDDPLFIHIRLKEEVEWDQQQRSDTSNIRISVPVRARDGDLCRYCGVIVHWKGPKSPRKGTLDHTVPKDTDGRRQPATVATMVVACLSCNSEMKDAAGEERLPMRPEPVRPFYSKATAEWLTQKGHVTRPTTADSDSDDSEHRAAQEQPPATRTAGTARPAASDPAPAGHRAATGDPNTHAPPRETELSPFDQDEERDSAGTGRDGTGNAPLSSLGTPNAAARRRRSRRGRARAAGDLA